MRITGLNAMLGVNTGAGIGTQGSSSPMVDQIIEAESAPIESSKQRRASVQAKKSEFKTLESLLSKLQSTSDSIKQPSGFRKLMVDSSHPDILSGNVSAGAEIGSYEFEVAGLARSDKQLALGFPDKDKTEVGFGYMRVGVKDVMQEVVIEPGSTLKDVAAKINESGQGVRASIINTGAKEDPFRLLVSSLEPGEDAVVDIDPDTTFHGFKNQVKGRDLDVKFEGVDVKRSSNALHDLIDGVDLKASKAAPGTNITVSVRHDVDRTSEGVREFVKQYNEVQSFSRKQGQQDGATGVAGPLSGEASVRQVSRSLQSAVSGASLVEAGITTNPKSGELQLDEAKLKEALTSNYEGIANLFATGASGPGLAARMSDAIKGLQDRASGAVATRVKGLEQRLKSQDQEISRKEERMTERRAQLQRTFANLDSKMAGMQSQGQILSTRLGPTN
jgi:flagellar hook-associated protein 2